MSLFVTHLEWIVGYAHNASKYSNQMSALLADWPISQRQVVSISSMRAEFDDHEANPALDGLTSLQGTSYNRVTLEDADLLAQDRQQWKNLVQLSAQRAGTGRRP